MKKNTILIFLIIFVFLSTAIARDNKRDEDKRKKRQRDTVEVVINPIDPNVFLKKGKTLISHIDEEEELNFTTKGVANNSFEIPVFVDRENRRGIFYRLKDKQKIPLGSSFVDGLFHWSPTSQQSGVYNIIFSAKYKKVEDKQTVNIIVANNIFTMKVGSTYRRIFRAYDVDGDDIDIRVIDAPKGATVIGKAFKAKLFIWKPSLSQVGIHDFTVIAIDYPLDKKGNLIQELQKRDIRKMRIIVEKKERKKKRGDKR